MRDMHEQHWKGTAFPIGTRDPVSSITDEIQTNPRHGSKDAVGAH